MLVDKAIAWLPMDAWNERSKVPVIRHVEPATHGAAWRRSRSGEAAIA